VIWVVTFMGGPGTPTRTSNASSTRQPLDRGVGGHEHPLDTVFSMAELINASGLRAQPMADMLPAQ
jgi:hypothetical protein